MKKIIFYFAFLIIFSQVVCAVNVLEIDFSIGSDNVVNLNEMRIRDNVLPTPFFIPGDYTLQILDSSGNLLINENLGINFCKMSNPPVCYDKTSVYFALEFSENMKVFKLFHEGAEIFQTNIILCNNNGVCDGFEDFLSCPQDCPINKNDVICLPESDGVCDPDCGQGVDPDCSQEFYPNAGEDKAVFFKEDVDFHGGVTSPGSGSYTYEWLFEDEGSTLTGQDVTHVFSEAGVFAVTLTVTNQDGVSKEDTLLVTVSGLGCRVTNYVCNGVSVFKMASLTNSHAQLQGDYSYSVCCSDIPGLGTDSSGAVVLNFAREDDSHVQKSDIGTYPLKAYLSAPDGVTCGYVESSGDGYSACEGAGFDTCLASIYDSDNSHIGDCSAYNVKVCCKVGGESGGFWSWLGFSWFIDYFDKIIMR